ncbi:hypothetical protein, partial [Chryseobacterium indoltheticum]|uniref:hypothetical protein n=1 Tax=Chryseobacterium indoltheticum TaxID=254 RepID=UPI003F491ECB
YASFSYQFGCLTWVERSRIGVFAFIVKRFRVFRAPLHRGDIIDILGRINNVDELVSKQDLLNDLVEKIAF